MNAKKVLQQAFKSIPDKYVNREARIYVRGREDNDISTLAVIVAHPTLDHIIFTREKGWEKLYE